MSPSLFGSLTGIDDERRIRARQGVVEGHFETPAHGSARGKVVHRGSLLAGVGGCSGQICMVLMMLMGVRLMAICTELHIPSVTHATGEVCKLLHSGPFWGLREKTSAWKEVWREYSCMKVGKMQERGGEAAGGKGRRDQTEVVRCMHGVGRELKGGDYGGIACRIGVKEGK